MSDIVEPVDKHASDHIERKSTDGGHLNRWPHPDYPIVNRTLASPSPLGLLSFATGKPFVLGSESIYLCGSKEYFLSPLWGFKPVQLPRPIYSSEF
jgi:hypothetical protein